MTPSQVPCLAGTVSAAVTVVLCADDENIDSLAKTFLSTSASEEHQSQFNCSYVRYIGTYCSNSGVYVSDNFPNSTSPARYPGYFYSGPPIPLNFEEEDSSTEEVPGKTLYP